MDLARKLEVLSNSAKYDASCSSSGSSRQSPRHGTGAAVPSGVCHSWSADGRCVSLLKVLYTNLCIYDCAYCLSRRSNDIERASFTPNELARLTMDFYRRNFIEGLFLSSAVAVSPDHTMERMLRVLELLRWRHHFGGYIHLKLIPGASETLIQKASLLADRLSSNIELPSSGSLARLAPQKDKARLLAPMRQVKQLVQQGQDEARHLRHAPRHHRAGMTTQMIVGASDDSDHTILTLSENLYGSMGLKRVYYSAYVPLNQDSLLPPLTQEPPLLREHRLYQADWLLRFYGFRAAELLSRDIPNLDTRFDPKLFWALHHLESFPLHVESASYEELLRVPGIGVRGARQLVTARRQCRLREEDLKKLGIVMKRARFFLCLGGRYLGNSADLTRESLLESLLSRKQQRARAKFAGAPALFDEPDLFDPSTDIRLSALSGEL